MRPKKERDSNRHGQTHSDGSHIYITVVIIIDLISTIRIVNIVNSDIRVTAISGRGISTIAHRLSRVQSESLAVDIASIIVVTAAAAALWQIYRDNYSSSASESIVE